MSGLGGGRSVGLGGHPRPDVGGPEDAAGVGDPGDDLSLEGRVERVGRGPVGEGEKHASREVGRAGAGVPPLDARRRVAHGVGDRGDGRPVEVAVEDDVVGIVARPERVVLGPDDEPERGAGRTSTRPRPR